MRALHVELGFKGLLSSHPLDHFFGLCLVRIRIKATLQALHDVQNLSIDPVIDLVGLAAEALAHLGGLAVHG